MRVILTLALKDLRLLLRDRFGLFWVIAFPLMQALFFGSIFRGSGGGPSGMSIAVVDEDRSDASRDFVRRLSASEALRVQALDRAVAREEVRKGRLTAYVAIQKGFAESDSNLWQPAAGIEVGLDPSRRAESGYLQGLLMEARLAGTMQQFSDPASMRRIADRSLQQVDASDMPPAQKAATRLFLSSLKTFSGSIEPPATKPAGKGMTSIQTTAIVREGTRPRSSFEVMFPSAMLWGVIGCTATFAISMVVERRTGTLLRLRVAPLSRRQMLGGKALSSLAACVAVMNLLITVGRIAFGVRVTNLFTLSIGVVCTAACFVGITMLVSVLGRTERGVAGAGWAVLMTCAMIGGGMIPLIAMPPWMQTASHFSPVKWGILALEGAIWRDFSLREMLLPCAILLTVGAACFVAGAIRMRRLDG